LNSKRSADGRIRKAAADRTGAGEGSLQSVEPARHVRPTKESMYVLYSAHPKAHLTVWANAQVVDKRNTEVVRPILETEVNPFSSFLTSCYALLERQAAAVDYIFGTEKLGYPP
jgi:hypothetical protein